MNKVEVLQLFKTIKQDYPNFETPKEKVDHWHERLQKVSFDAAKENYDRYFFSKNTFPPGISDMLPAADPQREPHSIYHEQLKGAAQAHLADLESWREKAVPPPAHVKERMRQLAER